MRVLKAVSAAILAAAVAGSPVSAQPLTQVEGPKEPPPAGFAGNQYVDSAGCVFIRAGVGGQTTWVPRVSRDRKLVCGYQPTFPQGTPEAVAATTAPADAPAETPGAGATPAPAEAGTAGAGTAATAEPETPVAAAPAPVAAPTAKPAAVAAPARDLRALGPVRLVRAAPVARAATLCLEPVPSAQRYLLSDGRRVTRCAASAPEDAVAYLNGLSVPGLTVVPGAPSPAEARRALRADAGAYRVVWQRGEIAAAPAPAPAGATVPAGQGAFVQVGVYAEPANADGAIARLKAMGLPVASATGTRGGRAVKAILAGPFASTSDVQAALVSVRKAGYRDAYIRG